jgi:hypothetical protein
MFAQSRLSSYVRQKMKNRRKALAVVSGCLFLIGYLCVGELSSLTAPRLLVATIFGIGFAISMIHHPERTTRRMVLCLIAPLLIGLIAFVGFTESPRVLATTTIWAIVFFVSQWAFALTLPDEVPNAASPEE